MDSENRPIEGPAPYRPRYSSAEAGVFVQTTNKGFDKLMAQHCPTVRPIFVGKKKFWTWLDVAVLWHVLTRGETTRENEAEDE